MLADNQIIHRFLCILHTKVDDYLMIYRWVSAGISVLV